MLSCFLLPSVRSVVIRGYSCTPNPNKVSLRSKMHKWGAAAAYCCARLLVARANRAVIVFALLASPSSSSFGIVQIPLRYICPLLSFRSSVLFRFFCPTLSAVVVVFASFVPQSAHTTTNHIKTQARAVIPSLIAFVPHFFRSLIPALALPTKKLHCTAIFVQAERNQTRLNC